MQVLLAAVRVVEAAGFKPVIVVISPDVGKFLRDANLSVPECIEFAIHPSGAAVKGELGSAKMELGQVCADDA